MLSSSNKNWPRELLNSKLNGLAISLEHLLVSIRSPILMAVRILSKYKLYGLFFDLKTVSQSEGPFQRKEKLYGLSLIHI